MSTQPTTPDPLRVGIVGVGFAGAAHLEAVRRTGLADVVAVAASSEQSARRAAERLGVARSARSYRELVEGMDVDLVHNCTPNTLHAEVATAALEAAKHLVTEKPLATTSAEAEALVRLGSSSGVVTAVCHNYRHYAMVQEARRLVADGTIGAVHMVHGAYLQDWLSSAEVDNWRLDPQAGGRSLAFADVGTHWCDLACHILRARITSVTARAGRLHQRTGEDHAGALLTFSSGAFGVVAISQVSPGEKNRLRIRVEGSEGSLAWDQERPDELWLGRAGYENAEIRKNPALLGDAVARLAHVPAGHPEGWSTSFKNLFLSVYRTVRGCPEDGDDVFATLAEAHERVQLIEMFLESASTGAPVAAPPPRLEDIDLAERGTR